MKIIIYGIPNVENGEQVYDCIKTLTAEAGHECTAKIYDADVAIFFASGDTPIMDNGLQQGQEETVYMPGDGVPIMDDLERFCINHPSSKAVVFHNANTPIHYRLAELIDDNPTIIYFPFSDEGEIIEYLVGFFATRL